MLHLHAEEILVLIDGTTSKDVKTMLTIYDVTIACDLHILESCRDVDLL
jgi:hypothetical protein